MSNNNLEGATDLMRDLYIESATNELHRYIRDCEESIIEVSRQDGVRFYEAHKSDMENGKYLDKIKPFAENLIREHGYVPQKETPMVFEENHFLSVEFHDNDFFYAFVNGLEMLWSYVNKRKADEQNIINIFVEAHERGVLHEIIHRWICFAKFREPTERVLKLDGYQNRPNLNINSILSEPNKNLINYLASFEIRFHSDNEFIFDWENGEHHYLNLITGKANNH